MTTVTVCQQPGVNPANIAREAALARGFNCYSKPSNPELFDYQDGESFGFYYSKSGSILEVVVSPTVPVEKMNSMPAVAKVEPVLFTLF
jgi:hypothetical protein